jgi:hypothetical protein
VPYAGFPTGQTLAQALGPYPQFGTISSLWSPLVAQLKDDHFLLDGLHNRVDLRPTDGDEHRQFVRVEEGNYEKGVFNFLRIWNGDETDWGLNFGAEPLVLRVSLATY